MSGLVVWGQPANPPASQPPTPAAQARGVGTAPQLPDLPRAVSSFGAATADGWLYVYGGHGGKTHRYSRETALPSLHRYRLVPSDPAVTAWQALPGGPATQGLALVSHAGKLYRLGGMQPRNAPGDPADMHSLADCACYDPATGQWQALPDLPEGRSSHDAVVVGQTLFVVGGWCMKGTAEAATWHESALALKLTDTAAGWQTLPQPFMRRALYAVVHQQRVWVIGGLDSEGAVQRRIDIFDPATHTWSRGPSLPKPKLNGFSPAAVSVGDCLYLSTGDGKLYALRGDDTTWQAVGQLRQARIVHRMVAWPGAVGIPATNGLVDRLIVLGGAAMSGDQVALVECLDLTRPALLGPAAPAPETD